MYEQQLREWVRDAACYRGFIEAWGGQGAYAKQETIEKCVPCVLWTEADGSGSISGAPIGKSSYNCGTAITLTAAPASGWRFVRWGGNISSESSTITFTLDASKSLTAFFEEIPPPPPPPDDGGEAVFINYGSPILIDLSTESFRLTSSSDGVLFDLRNEGVKRQVAWTRPAVENAFLALDRNGNGVIDSGAELFGNFTALVSGQLARHGFEALDELDEDRDGIVDASDPAWLTLLLWTDRNHDGHSASDELVRIAESPIVALETSARVVGKKDGWGNMFRYMSHARLSVGNGEARRPYYDVFLAIEP